MTAKSTLVPQLLKEVFVGETYSSQLGALCFLHNHRRSPLHHMPSIAPYPRTLSQLKKKVLRLGLPPHDRTAYAPHWWAAGMSLA
jgi:hypothetical protein